MIEHSPVAIFQWVTACLVLLVVLRQVIVYFRKP